MRILWFVNTPSLAQKKLDVKGIGGGWIKSLEKIIGQIKSVELGIVFPYEKYPERDFKIHNTTYFPIKRGYKWKLSKFIFQQQRKIENTKELNHYLSVIDSFKPDLIHVFGTESGFGRIISKVKYPVVIQIQGIINSILEFYYPPYFSNWDIIKNTPLSVMIKGNSFVHAKSKMIKQAVREKEILQNAKYIIGRTQWDKSITSILAPKAKYFHCDEVMRDSFYCENWEDNNNNNNIKIITTISNNLYKGYDIVLKSAKILINNGLSFEWNICGIDSNSTSVKIIENKLKLYHNNLNIHLKGFLETKDLVPLMLKSDIFVHPSKIDNSSNSVCEALLLGMPVIGSYTGGLPTIINNGKNGILIQNMDPLLLAQAIIELKNNKAYKIKLANMASIEAQARHDKDIIKRRLINIYMSILNEI